MTTLELRVIEEDKAQRFLALVTFNGKTPTDHDYGDFLYRKEWHTYAEQSELAKQISLAFRKKIIHIDDFEWSNK